jgi:cathepsin L
MNAFAGNLQKIFKHNKEAAEGKHTYTLGINKFADLTEQEWRDSLTLKVVKDDKPKFQMKSKIVNIPDEVDWRDEGYVTPVKDQAQCGSCWAFSTTGSMEGALVKAGGDLVSLSEQNLVDCDTADGGCNGGLMENAFRWLLAGNSLNTEANYPYEAKDKSCRFDASKDSFTISAFHEINEQDEADLTNKIASEGPISVAIDAGKFSFQLYHDGVYYEPSCSSTRLNHGVLAVGYGTEDG